VTSRCVPLATYRLQFNASFRFSDAIGILDYLHDLGISHVYASPVLTSRRGSIHGYDVTDPSKIDPDLGGEEGFAVLQGALDERGMGLLLDIVPNHMAASSENPWWMDVLEYGPDSSLAFHFDIDWRPPSRGLANKLLLPFLGKPFGEALDGGEFKVQWENGRFFLRYGEQDFPISPGSYAEILSYSEAGRNGAVDIDSPARREWKGIIAVAESIAADHNPGTPAAAERRSKFQQMRERLGQLLASSPDVMATLDRALEVINGVPGDARSVIGLEHILSNQYYRLAFWRTPSESINYRRFFSIADLVGVRVEDPAVFQASHDTTIRLGFKPRLRGFRIDHIDGLRDPAGYLNRLTERLSSESSNGHKPYLVVEKILERGESLPEDWPVAGTTGYDYLNFANRLLIDAQQSGAIEKVYARWTATSVSFDDTLYQNKKLVMRSLLAVEVRSLGRLLAELARDDRYARELDPIELSEALIEVTACLPVYRTYVQSLDVPNAAQSIVPLAIDKARSRRSNLTPACFDFLSDVLLLTAREHTRPEQREARLAFVMRWQQFTSPVMAKGLEDTALYIYLPLASLNEVGGDPRLVGTDPFAFHEFIASRMVNWPNSMNATTTHDTKRSEDTRARIAVLSEIPHEWECALRSWSQANQRFASQVNGATVPDRNEEYLFYQTLIGAWPLAEDEWPTLVPRLQDYIVKATREAMVHTRWTRPHEPHESALRDFVCGVLDRDRNSQFCSCFELFQQRTALYGMLNGLGQVVLKVASPGVPDLYQGSELWDLRLVDPDNRGPVDFPKRGAMLAALFGAPNWNCSRYVQDLLENWRDGRVKLYVLAQALRLRHKYPNLFTCGEYQPLKATGPHRDRLLAFARVDGHDHAIAVIPRCIAGVRAPVLGADRSDFWQDTLLELPNKAAGRWVNVFAGASAPAVSIGKRGISLADVFGGFPVALMLPAGE
jgi:(1->4)-alpha-D-glucan 1-alpha-D-glucosylmutase